MINLSSELGEKKIPRNKSWICERIMCANDGIMAPLFLNENSCNVFSFFFLSYRFDMRRVRSVHISNDDDENHFMNQNYRTLLHELYLRNLIFGLDRRCSKNVARARTSQVEWVFRRNRCYIWHRNQFID